MPTSGRPRARFAVRIGVRVWRDEVERFGDRTSARIAAERERGRLERDGIDPSALHRCDAEAPDGTRLAGLVKVYVPIIDGPPSERPSMAATRTSMHRCSRPRPASKSTMLALDAVAVPSSLRDDGLVAFSRPR